MVMGKVICDNSEDKRDGEGDEEKIIDLTQ